MCLGSITDELKSNQATYSIQNEHNTANIIGVVGFTVLVLIKLTKFVIALRLRCGFCKLIFDIISSFFAKFKNVVHSSEPGETPSNSPGSKLCATFLNIANYFKMLWCGCVYFF